MPVRRGSPNTAECSGKIDEIAKQPPSFRPRSDSAAMMGTSDGRNNVKRRRNYFLPILVSAFSLFFSACFLTAGIVLMSQVLSRIWMGSEQI